MLQTQEHRAFWNHLQDESVLSYAIYIYIESSELFHGSHIRKFVSSGVERYRRVDGLQNITSQARAMALPAGGPEALQMEVMKRHMHYTLSSSEFGFPWEEREACLIPPN